MPNLEGLRDGGRSQFSAAERRERLEYLADLLSELQVLAEREGCARLPSLIALARADAIDESMRSGP